MPEAADFKQALKHYSKRTSYARETDYRKIIALLPSPPRGDSFAARRPALSEHWSQRNSPLRPEMFREFAHVAAWWTCPAGHPEYRKTFALRSRGQGCPRCGRLQAADRLRKTKASAGNSVADHPELFALWHPDKNASLNPRNIAKGSKDRVWWKCRKGHEWELTVASQKKRVKGPCDECRSLVAVRPDLAEEWHPTLNGSATPERFSYGSRKTVWWRCGNGHAWRAVISNRTAKNGTGCRKCNARRKA